MRAGEVTQAPRSGRGGGLEYQVGVSARSAREPHPRTMELRERAYKSAQFRTQNQANDSAHFDAALTAYADCRICDGPRFEVDDLAGSDLCASCATVTGAAS